MADSISLDREREFLLEHTLVHGARLRENLGRVVDYLYGNLPFITMLNHAKNLPNTNRNSRQYDNIRELIAKINEKDINIVKNYVIAVGEYLKGKPFKPVREAAKELSFSKPMPDTIYAPLGTFSKELIEAYEVV